MVANAVSFQAVMATTGQPDDAGSDDSLGGEKVSTIEGEEDQDGGDESTLTEIVMAAHHTPIWAM